MNVIDLHYRIKGSTVNNDRHALMCIESDKVADALLEIFSQIGSGNADVLSCSVHGFSFEALVEKEVTK